MSDTDADSRVGTTRRTLVRGAAWSVPVVAVAATAPAYAASPCSTLVNQEMTWGTARYPGWTDRGHGFWRSNQRTAAYLTQDPDGSGPQSPLQVNITVSVSGSDLELKDDQLTITGQNVGGTSSRGLTLHQKKSSNRSKQVVTFAFSRPVSSLTFTVTDIDSSDEDYRDAVAITGATISSYAIQDPARVQGVGSVTNPFRASGSNYTVNDYSGSNGNVTVTLTNVSTFHLHFWNNQDEEEDEDQKVFLTNFKASYFAC